MTDWNSVNVLEEGCLSLLLADGAAFVGAVVGAFLAFGGKFEV